MECLAFELFLDLVSWVFSNARGGVKISFLIVILTDESALVPASLNRFIKSVMSSSVSSPSLTMIVDVDDLNFICYFGVGVLCCRK